MPSLRRAIVLGAVLTAGVARADSVQKCVDASELGQKAQREGRLLDARAAFLECAADKCPAVVKTACGQWLDQVTAALPSLVVAVTDDEKRDIVDARISVDGKPVSLGRSMQLDPGPHTIAVDADGFDSATEQIVARETEHARTVAIVLNKHVEPAPPSPAPAPPEDGRSIRPITWITGGLSLAGLATFATFAAIGRSEASELRSSCAPYCSESDRDKVHTKYVVADVSLVVGLVLAGVSVWTYLSHPHLPQR